MRACADDLAAVLKELRALIVAERVFAAAERLARLILRPSNCVILLLKQPVNPATIFMVRRFLNESVPNWIG